MGPWSCNGILTKRNRILTKFTCHDTWSDLRYNRRRMPPCLGPPPRMVFECGTSPHSSSRLTARACEWIAGHGGHCAQDRRPARAKAACSAHRRTGRGRAQSSGGKDGRSAGRASRRSYARVFFVRAAQATGDWCPVGCGCARRAVAHLRAPSRSAIPEDIRGPYDGGASAEAAVLVRSLPGILGGRRSER